MKVGSLFSGIGGMDLGLERAGMEIAWQVEIDEWCRRVLAKHWPEVPKYGDIRELDAGDLPRVDLLCGGFPCQPVSSAGKQLGIDDERWLWPEFARLIRLLRPSWILAENVPRLLSVNSGRAFGEVIRDLAQSGYCIEWDCIPAAAVGASHRRDRIWIVAHSTENGRTRTIQPRREEDAGQDSRGSPGSALGSSNMAHADQNGREERTWLPAKRRSHWARPPTNHASGSRIFGGQFPAQLAEASCENRIGIWGSDPADYPLDVKSRLDRVVDGSTPGLDKAELRRRIGAIGNAVVPQVVEAIGRRIMEVN